MVYHRVGKGSRPPQKMSVVINSQLLKLSTGGSRYTWKFAILCGWLVLKSDRVALLETDLNMLTPPACKIYPFAKLPLYIAINSEIIMQLEKSFALLSPTLSVLETPPLLGS